ncbi:RNA polymerase sigma factor [Actinomadura rubteroloni]|uniref:RNA polymerase sigma factor n=1 Tax=Actinomadura rubteroloni TaxID=1926885 RepID=A0A2P4UL68_9ACTN|nr:sigma-70 family RNA polymerase sigma factor [Actinomadura rubteroloni]POM25792.1 RNA polymerase sigma factor [Actinomadura rubteroloni]
MDDHLLVEALRTHEPDAPAAVYEAYGEALYSYCRSRLGDDGAAAVAVRDALIVADTHVWRLREPARFRPWLYALAAVECARATPVPPEPRDDGEPGPRRAARRAVAALSAEARDVLALRYVHGIEPADLAAVTGGADGGLERAHRALEAVLTAEILAETPCPDRDSVTPERPGKYLQHVRDCAVCSPRAPRTVAAAKVFAALPRQQVPRTLRPEVIACFRDPEMVGRRLFVAGRVAEFGQDGFPGPSRRPSGRGGRRAFALVAAATALTAVAGGASLLWGGGSGATSGVARSPAADERTEFPPASPRVKVGEPVRSPRTSAAPSALPVSATVGQGAQTTLSMPPGRSEPAPTRSRPPRRSTPSGGPVGNRPEPPPEDPPLPTPPASAEPSASESPPASTAPQRSAG